MAGGTKRPGWVNPAGLPSVENQTQAPFDSQREQAALRVLRKRYLNPAGTFIRYPVPASVLTVTVNFVAPEPDFRYGVLAFPNFPAGAIYSSVKNVNNCVINFTGTSPADGSGRFDILIFRSEYPNFDGT